MADRYVIDTVFKTTDQMSNSVNALSTRMTGLGRRMERAFERGTFGATKFKTVLGGVLGANLITAGLNRLRQGISGLTDEFLDFDQAITSAAAKYKFDRGTKEFETLGKAARDVAAVTPYTAAQSGRALNYLAMAGFQAEQAISALPGVTNLAIAGDMELAQASDIASDALSALGLMSKEPEKLATNLNRINDVMAKVANTANTDIPMLWESLKPASSVASQLGASIEQLGAMFGTLASSGVKAETAGTALRNIYLRLTSGTREVDKVLQKYNVNIQDQHGKLRPMIDILDEVSKKTKNLDDKTRQAAYSHLFGTRAVNSAMILMKAGKDTIFEYQEQLEGASGAADDLAKRMGQSIPNRLAALKSKLIETGFRIIDMFKDRIPGAIDKTIDIIDRIDTAAVADSINNVISTVREYWDVIKNITAAIVIYNIIVKTATALQWAFNVAAAANPLGLLIIALTAVGFAIYKIWENWNALVAQMKQDASTIVSKIVPGSRFDKDVLGWLGLEDTRQGVAESEYRNKEGYILGGKSSENSIAYTVDKRNKDTVAVSSILGTFNTAEKASTDYAMMLDNMAKNEALQESLKGTGVNAETAAYLQKIAFEGKLTFAGAPDGTRFEQTTKGAPPIKHNLGSNY